MPIRIIITGGTFDKQYDAIRGELNFGHSHLPQILQRVRLTRPVQLQSVHMVDSLQMTDDDRRRIAQQCADADEQQIIITHGTDTMCQTAKVIGRLQLNKTIALTGAMVPYSVSGSDALFNLGCAVMTVQLASPGVYIVMNGRAMDWQHTRKNKALGIFESDQD